MNKKCFYCGAHACSTDHLVSKKMGGNGSPDNLVPCCRSCNSSKGAKSIEDFRIWKTFKLLGCPGFSGDQKDWLLKTYGINLYIPNSPLVTFFGEGMQ